VLLDAAIIAGAMAAGFVQGLSGFAFSLVALAFWVWLVPPHLIGPMAVVGAFIGQLLAFRTLALGFNLRRLAPLLLGGIIGVPLGVFALTHIDPVWFKGAVGLFLVIYASLALASRDLPRIAWGGGAADAAVGLFAGAMGGLGGMAGSPPALWGILRGWSRDERRAVVQAFSVAMHVITLTIYASTGILTVEVGWKCLLVAPAMLIPTFIGQRLYQRVSERAFTRIVLILLAASGLAMLAASVPALVSRPR
jgi:uncharacterized membrane protein YfcA